MKQLLLVVMLASGCRSPHAPPVTVPWSGIEVRSGEGLVEALRECEGHHPVRLLEDSRAEPVFATMLGDQFETLKHNMLVAGPMRLINGYYFAHGNGPHAGGIKEAAFAVDAQSGKIVVAILDGDFSGPPPAISLFGADSPKTTPPALLEVLESWHGSW